MQRITLKRPLGYKSYLINKYEGDTIFLLADCLNDIWIERLDEYISWALDPNEWYLGMNVANLDKENNDYILISSQISDEPDGGPFFKISINEFVKLLSQWKKLVEEGVQEITIIENDDHKLEITGEKYPI